MSDKKEKEIKVETVEEFLARGGKIEKLPYMHEEPNLAKSGKTKHTAPQLMSLAEGEFWFGEKNKRRKKVKVPDFSKVDMTLISDELKDQLGLTDGSTQEGIGSDQKSDTPKESQNRKE